MSIETETIQILNKQVILYNDKNCHCKIDYIHVKITDIESRANAMLASILDKTWLCKLDSTIDRVSFLARSEATINLMCKVLSEAKSIIGKEFGEYIISCSALDILEHCYEHKIFPLAELWKEEVKGNPGFDLHSLSQEDILFFGEAKYNSRDNSYNAAIKQICRFVSEKKNLMELTDLKKLENRILDEHAQTDKTGFIAAFSLHGNFENILDTIMKNKHLNSHNMFKYPAIHFIGIEVCPSED